VLEAKKRVGVVAGVLGEGYETKAGSKTNILKAHWPGREGQF